MQWKMVGKFFYVHTLHFMLFLSVYFFFIVGIFYHEDKEKWCNTGLDKSGNITACRNCPTLFSGLDNGFLVCEILLMITTITLTIRETIQFASRRVFTTLIIIYKNMIALHPLYMHTEILNKQPTYFIFIFIIFYFEHFTK